MSSPGWALDLTNPLAPTVVVEGQTLEHLDRISVDWRRGQVPVLYLTSTSVGVLDGIGPVMEHPSNQDERPALLALLNDIDPHDLEQSVMQSGSLGDSLGVGFLEQIKRMVAGG